MRVGKRGVRRRPQRASQRDHLFGRRRVELRTELAAGEDAHEGTRRGDEDAMRAARRGAPRANERTGTTTRRLRRLYARRRGRLRRHGRAPGVPRPTAARAGQGRGV